MTSNGGKRRGKDTRDLPIYPAKPPKRPGGFNRQFGVGSKETAESGKNPSRNTAGLKLWRALWRLHRSSLTRESLLPPGAGRAVWFGFQTWLVSWAVMVLLAIVVWAQYSGLPSMQNSTWRTALSVGNGIYATSFGAAVSNSTVSFSLTPWGITLFLGFLLGGSLKVAKPGNAWALWWGICGFLIPTWVSLGFASLSLTVWPAFLTTIIFAAAIFVLVSNRFPWGKLAKVFPDNEPWPWLVLSGHFLRVLSCVALAAGLLVLLVALIVGWPEMVSLWNGLHPGVFGGFILVLGLLAYLPTLLVWALSWLVGPGITVGLGTVFAPGQVISGDLPPVPFLAWLPPAAIGFWPLAIPVLAAIVTGILMSRRHKLTLSDTLLSLAFFLAIMLGGGFVITLGVTGDLGPGRLRGVGPMPAVPYAGVIAWGVPFAVTLVLGHRRVGQEVSRFAARIAGKDTDSLPTTKLDLG